MPFPERLLGEYEELVYDLHPHWWTIVGPIAVAAVTVLAGSFLYAIVPSGGAQDVIRLVLLGVVLVILLLWVLPRWLRWRTTHFVLTTDRIILRSGVLAKFAREIPLERLNDVTFRQSFWERLIGAGDLLIESAGEHGQSSFTDMPHPEEVQLEIYQRMEANGQRMASGASGASGATPPAGRQQPADGPTEQMPRRQSLVDDLERLADLRDRGVLTDEEFERKKRDLLDRM